MLLALSKRKYRCSMKSLSSERESGAFELPPFETLVALLQQQADHYPDKIAYIFLVDGEQEEATITYRQLDQRARAIAAVLQKREMVGKRVLLLYPPGLDYIAGFFGCLYAGAVAVPAYPPRPNRPTPRLSAIVVDAQAAVALTTPALLANIERRFQYSPELESLRWLVTEDIPTGEAERWQKPDVTRDSLAFLQYTSGSTSAPKGVMLTHANLLYNLALIHYGFGTSKESSGVSWLPPYHDMGLIGGILEPLYSGVPTTLLSPMAFLQRPYNWLRAISHYRSTINGGPDFAYTQCIEKTTPEERATLDLSCWQVAFSGAEPVRADTLDRFVEVFEPCGFRREAFYPCYGLAEASLIVSGGLNTTLPIVKSFKSAALGQGRVLDAAPDDPDGQRMVGCGATLPGQKIVIANSETFTPCAPNQIGEIWVSGPSVAQGYWNHPELTEETFHTRLAGSADAQFLRTGDLGFMRDGELFVAGRIKDLIIIRGRNHYPQDIELTVERCHPAVQSGRCAAFSVDVAGEERLVVVQEINRHFRQDDVIAEVAAAMRLAVSEAHELQVYAVVLIRPWSIPTTSSGKIQRHVCRERFLTDALEVVASDVLAQTPGKDRSEPSDMALTANELLQAAPDSRQALLTTYLQARAAKALRVAPSEIDVEQPLGALGLDSLMVIDLKHAIEINFGVELTMTEFLESPGITALVRDVLARIVAAPQPAPAQPAGTQSVATQPAAVADYPLSHGQRSLWFMYQLAPDSAAYNVPATVHIHSEVNVEALRACLETLVARHATLRTTFAASENGPVQRVHADFPLDFEMLDAAGWPETILRDSLIEYANRAFDLERGPLLRVRLFRKSPQEQVFMVVMHHIITDFWSLALLVDELRRLYPAVSRGQTLKLPALALTYSDYARRQGEMLAGPEGARLRDYWLKQLAGELPVLQLPLDHPRPPVQTYNGDVHVVQLRAELCDKLKTLARDHGATLYMTLLAAFTTLLYRYTGQRDLLVGTLAAGRSHAQLTDVMGYFVNPLVLRATVSPGRTFTEILEHVRATVLNAFEHQDYPFDALVDQLQPVRDYSRSPLFQVMFVYQKAYRLDDLGMTPFALDIPGATMELAGLHLESLPLQRHVSQFDLTLTMGEADGRMIAAFEYNSDLFAPQTIARMAGHLEMLLNGVAANPDQQVAELPLLTYAEQVHYLSLWNGPQQHLPFNATVQSLFEAQVARTPEAVAVIAGEQQLTYHQLNQRAAQLASYLRERGVGPERIVGIYLERSVEMILSVIAVLKTGGAYLPLDPTYPQERLEFMLANAGASALITLDSMRETAPAFAQTICLDTEWPEIEAKAGRAGPLRAAGALHNLACVIYTSGSTGQPKGVLLENTSIVNLILSFIQSYAPTPQDRILPLTSVASASFVGEILPLLCAGGALVLAPETEFLDMEAFFDLLARQQVTIVSTVPSFITGLNARKANLSQLRLLLSGGEALTANDINYLLQSVAVINSYGVTETTVCSTYHSLSPESTNGGSGVPIGHPIINTDAYVLDENLNHLPVNCPGELYIAGPGLARGYLDNPALTAQRFVPNPYSPGARMYRTGDLARRLPDGALEYLQRVDNQVKIRGFRIELGEIEAALKSYPDVLDAVVLAHRNGGDARRLIAYVSHGATEVSQEVLYSWLVDRLPPYMAPSHIIVLETLPLTPNGKIDVHALPDPGAMRPALGAEYVAPQSDLERAIAAIWQAVLHIETVGIHDNFFELGGNSLLIAQVHQRLRDELKLELSLVDMFKYPTIHTLAFNRRGKDSGSLTQVKQETAQHKAARDRRRELLKQRRGQ